MAECKIEKLYILTLSEKEREWLKGRLQDYHGVTTEEPPEDYEIRIELREALVLMN